MRPEDLIGTWSLESFTAKGSDGVEGLPFGESPQGLLTYTASGHMAAVLMRSGRPKFSSGDLRGGTPEEIKQAFEGPLSPEIFVLPLPPSGSSVPRWEIFPLSLPGRIPGRREG